MLRKFWRTILKIILYPVIYIMALVLRFVSRKAEQMMRMCNEAVLELPNSTVIPDVDLATLVEINNWLADHEVECPPVVLNNIEMARTYLETMECEGSTIQSVEQMIKNLLPNLAHHFELRLPVAFAIDDEVEFIFFKLRWNP